MGKAYVIGDKDNGLTIVLTDPVLVVRYEAKDFDDGSAPPEHNRARIVQDLITRFRNVNNDELYDKIESLWADHKDGQVATPPELERSMLEEASYANMIARTIAKGDTVTDVGFCLSFDMDNIEFARGGRNFEPAGSLTNFVKQRPSDPAKPIPINAFPQFDVGGLPADPFAVKVGKDK
jgi:hypothetical protein